MIRLVLAQMRRSKARLVAAGLAITISTAFVAIALLVSGVVERTAHDTLAARFGDADLVVEPVDTPLGPTTVSHIASLPQVRAAVGSATQWQELRSDTGSLYVEASLSSPDPRLQPYELLMGAAPTGPSTIALSQEAANRLKVSVGSQVRAPVWELAPSPSASADAAPAVGAPSQEQWVSRDETLTVTGIIKAPKGLFNSAEPALMTSAGLQVLAGNGTSEPLAYDLITVALHDRSAVPAAALSLAHDLGGKYQVLTIDEAVAGLMDAYLGSTVLFQALILGFAAIALLTAALVISNTFQVLVAQRGAQLALLRCVGATRRQIRTMVLQEAALLAVIASALGIALGIGLSQAALWAVGSLDVGVPVPGWVTVTIPVVAAPLVCGLATTMGAALLPARVATRVAPLEALRPAPVSGADSRGSRGRLVVALGAIAIGVVGLVFTVLYTSQHATSSSAALVGLAGGVVSASVLVVGLLLSAIAWMPPLLRLMSAPLRRGPLGRLASANLARNPRRAAATASALLIGMGLVSMMATGAASAQTTMDRTLMERNPIDVVVGDSSTLGDPMEVTGPAPQAQPSRLTPALVSAIGTVGGVARAATVSSTYATLSVSGPVGTWATVIDGVDVAAASQISRMPTLLAGLKPGVMQVTNNQAALFSLAEGQQLTLTTPRGQATVTVSIVRGAQARAMDSPRISAATMAELDPGAQTGLLWLRLADGASAARVSSDISVLAATMGDNGEGTVPVASYATVRQNYQNVVSTLLTVVLVLLAAAVVIALIGVANTLSLSVIERRRETAILRAVGLKRSGLRVTLALEGVLIALAGTLAGAVVGVSVGWVGTYVMLASTRAVELSLPGRTIAIAFAIALLAGLAASVLPARHAVRTPPVAALADE